MDTGGHERLAIEKGWVLVDCIHCTLCENILQDWHLLKDLLAGHGYRAWNRRYFILKVHNAFSSILALPGLHALCARPAGPGLPVCQIDCKSLWQPKHRLVVQGSNLFYFRDDMSNAAQVKGVLCLEGAIVSARPPLQEAQESDAERFCLVVRLATKVSSLAKHPVYTFSVDTAPEQVSVMRSIRDKVESASTKALRVTAG